MSGSVKPTPKKRKGASVAKTPKPDTSAFQVEIPEEEMGLAEMGFRPIVRHSGRRQEIVMLIGRQGMGKTHYALDIARRTAPDEPIILMDWDNNGQPAFDTLLEEYPDLECHRKAYIANPDAGFDGCKPVFEEWVRDFGHLLRRGEGTVIIDSASELLRTAMVVIPTAHVRKGAKKPEMRAAHDHIAIWCSHLFALAKSTRIVDEETGMVQKPGVNIISTVRMKKQYRGGAEARPTGKWEPKSLKDEYKHQQYTVLQLLKDERGPVVFVENDKGPWHMHINGVSYPYPAAAWAEQRRLRDLRGRWDEIDGAKRVYEVAEGFLIQTEESSPTDHEEEPVTL
jgi:hypothetical protein